MVKRLVTLIALWIWTLGLYAQIHGVVIDSDTGDPIPYLNIYYDGKGVGTITDIDGKYSIPYHEGWNKLTFSMVGYTRQDITVSSKTTELNVSMKSELVLDEVVVKPRKEKYSRKNNPAVELMKKVIASKQRTNLENKDYYFYNKYQKITLAVNDITPDSLRESWLFKKYPFLRDQVEICDVTQKRILPVSVDETVSQKIYRKEPRSEKTIIQGIDSKGINELFSTGDMLTTVLKDVFQDIDIYEDRFRFLQYPFDSPVSDAGIRFYKYYIMDTVYVEKGGEIIPKIVSVDMEKRLPGSRKVEFIETCPVCGAKLVRYDNEVAYYCPNYMECPPQIKGRIEHFISRKAMNIDGLGPETIDLFYENGLINDVADLYNLKADVIAGLERFAERSAARVIKSIADSKSVPYDRVIFAIGIRFVGETVAKKLARAFPSIDLLAAAGLQDLVSVDDIGERIAQSVVSFFHDMRNVNLIDRLRNAGLQMKMDVDTKKASDKLKGKTIVISGVFKKHSRDEYKKMIEDNGGKNAGSISSKTSFVLAGDNMGPSKLEKANALGVKIINEEEFLDMLGE